MDAKTDTPHARGFHFDLGQFAGVAILALQAYHQQDVSPGGAKIYTDPAVLLPYLQGLMSLFPHPSKVPAASTLMEAARSIAPAE